MTASCPKKPNIAEISPHLICALCGGYLIDATTIVECLHSFCKTCIVRYLESSKYCPICEVLVHKTRPLQNIRLDHTLQDIVYKLVPGLFQTEMQRRREFYKDSPTIRSAKTRQEQQRHRVIYSADEKFSLVLEFCPDGKVRKKTSRRSSRCSSKSKESIDKRYFLCPASATVALIKKFIQLKFTLPDSYKVDLFHAQGALLDHFSLMDVAYIYSWKREGVLHLYYSIYKDRDPLPQIEVTEVKQEEVKPDDHEDNRPSSLFTKAKLLGNHSVDGSIPHNLSPLELIATVANDISIQEGRGLKRKTVAAQLYEQEEENTEEIQIQKSIAHAIDICSNTSISAETKSTSTSTSQDNLKSANKHSVIFASPETPPVLAKPVSTAIITETSQTKFKPKDRPKTTDTASQCDPRPKKPKTEAVTASQQHSRSPAKNTKLDSTPKDTIKDDAKHTVNKTNSKEEATAKPDKVKTNGNNNIATGVTGLVHIVAKPKEKIVRDSNANQTIVTGRQIQEQVEKTALAIAAAQKANAMKTDTSTTVAPLNGLTSTTDVVKKHMNHATAKVKHVEGKD